ncbi:hypothetical protein DdX_22054 [Ditylenchus destructor]|uniref:Uncharacterized protein n=1 Tax=Ditylenchus destructor TaxID=166010 RepID=A0AAD4MIL9_9BILA|nr:hypothetical protein DdX_22054 [Ditylenchus destructor]
MEDLVKQMMAQTQMLQEALAKQAQESREREERAEERITALLASQTGLADSECEAKMRCVRVLEMAETDNRVVTLDELKEECKKIDIFNQSMAGFSNPNQSLNAYALKAQKTKHPRQEARYGRKQSTDSNDMEAGHVTGKNFYGDSSRHFSKMCKFKGGNKVNIGRINVNDMGSAQGLNSGAYGADEKMCEWEVKLSRMSTAQLKKMTKLMERTGCNNEDAINALEGNDYHLGNAESEIEAYGGAAGLRAIREAGEERKANQLRANQIRIRSTLLVKKASENSSKKSYNTKWTPGVVVARKAGGEYDVSEVEGQCMSASFQCVNEGTLVKITANQLRNRNAMSASEENSSIELSCLFLKNKSLEGILVAKQRK